MEATPHPASPPPPPPLPSSSSSPETRRTCVRARAPTHPASLQLFQMQKTPRGGVVGRRVECVSGVEEVRNVSFSCANLGQQQRFSAEPLFSAIIQPSRIAVAWAKRHRTDSKSESVGNTTYHSDWYWRFLKPTLDLLIAPTTELGHWSYPERFPSTKKLFENDNLFPRE